MGREPISNGNTLRFLTKLQHDLLEDRLTETAQADPIYYGILDTDDDNELRVADADAFLDFVEENEDAIDAISVAYIAYDEVIKPDAMFLTRKDARTYAMTACRSHRYETLIDMLRTIDLEKSHIVMAENTREAGGSDNDE